MNSIRTSFVYPELNEEHPKYGASFLAAPVIRPDGDWRKSLPPGEEQRRNGVEPSSCYVEANQHAIATIEENQLGEHDNNYSARFNTLLSFGTPQGGNPIAGGDSIRHDGLVKEEIMPHGPDLQSWEEYHSWKGVDETKVRIEGQQDLNKKKRNFGVLITRELPLATKYTLLKEGLKRSPIPISIWGATDSDGNYMQKPDGVNDTHLVEATYVDDNNAIYVLDTYRPFEKVLPPNYNPDFGMGWTVAKITVKKNWLQEIVENLLNLIKSIIWK